MPDLRQLRQFVAVAEELHFHRAAKRLNMSQPPLTAAIRKLEEEIGAPLILRENRTAGLTAAGKVLLLEAKRVLQQFDQAIQLTRDTANGHAGHLRLGYVGSALYGRFPEFIRQFRQQFPQIRLELIESTSSQQISLIRNGSLDIALVIPPISEAEDFRLLPFDSDRLAIAIARGHPLAAHPALTLAELKDEDFVLWPAREGRGFYHRVVKLCTDAGFVPQTVQEAHGMHAVLSLVAIGTGVSIVPASMSRFRSDKIRYFPLASAEASFELAYCYRAGMLSPAAGLLLEKVSQPQVKSGQPVLSHGKAY
ncbi:LysR family transcriptional regulator [Winslowiella iniecta]|uniref:LysR family transcriptional regulator n=1 Tax=Winslowiella iniecta TaxID=1560201 RepID=A0A0L7TE44_9GAMM|nr:LysR family transcriptional regulator [Winslowiella iniecta]KOC90491.1 LysR family transcriptional regulator [Winslowiella iniecta]KOC93630.1 LysR family transcriptional regulator [Winslowiella iniecta]